MFESLVEAAYEKIKETYNQAKAVADYAANFDGTLTGSVGIGGMNAPADVLTVRILLNQYIDGDKRMRPLSTIAIESPMNAWDLADATITAILYFQREIAGFNKPDGLIQVNGKTHKALLGEKAKTIKKKKVIENPIPELGSKPVRLTEDQVQGVTSSGTIALDYHGGGKAVISAGEVWMAVDGQRMVYSASYAGIYYVLLKPRGGALPGTYLQSARAFVSDVTIGLAAGEVATRCQYIRYLMELECELLIGLGCALSTPAALFMMMQEVGPFVMENYSKFPSWARLAYHMSRFAWTAYKFCPKFFHAVVELAVRRIWKHLGEGPMEFDAKKMAKLAGKLIGQVGMKGFTATAGALKTVVTAIVSLVGQVALTASVKVSVQEAQDQVNKLKAAVQSLGGSLEEPTAQKIVEELVVNAVVLYPVVRDLKQELENVL